MAPARVATAGSSWAPKRLLLKCRGFEPPPCLQGARAAQRGELGSSGCEPAGPRLWRQCTVWPKSAGLWASFSSLWRLAVGATGTARRRARRRRRAGGGRRTAPAGQRSPRRRSAAAPDPSAPRMGTLESGVGPCAETRCEGRPKLPAGCRFRSQTIEGPLQIT